MKKLCDNIAKSVANNLNMDTNKQQVMAYGLLAMMQMTVILICSVIIGLIFKFPLETIVVYFGVGLLRKATGGVHSESLAGCTIMSITIITLLSALSHYCLSNITSWLILLISQVAIYGLCAVIIYKKAPMDTPNKPITKPEKIKKLRKQSFLSLFVYLVISMTLFFISNDNKLLISLAFSINCALLWQTITLTKIGALIVGAGDKLFISKQ